MTIQPTTCFGKCVYHINQNKLATGITYLVIMVAFAVLMALPQMSTNVKAIVGYSFLGGHVLLASMMYPFYKESISQDLQKKAAKCIESYNEFISSLNLVELASYDEETFNQHQAFKSQAFILSRIDGNKVQFSRTASVNGSFISWMWIEETKIKDVWTLQQFQEKLGILKSTPSLKQKQI